MARARVGQFLANVLLALVICWVGIVGLWFAIAFVGISIHFLVRAFVWGWGGL